MQNAKYKNIGFYHLGHGFMVCDRRAYKNGDYERIAHIKYDRSVKYFENLTQELKDYIEDFAATDVSSISTSQPDKFVLKPLEGMPYPAGSLTLNELRTEIYERLSQITADCRRDFNIIYENGISDLSEIQLNYAIHMLERMEKTGGTL